MYGPGPFLYAIFLMIGWILMVYTINFYYLAYQSRNNIRHEKKMRQKVELPAALPVVTIQLPLYNEKYVAKRLIDAVCRMDYPRDRLEIIVVDNSSSDNTEEVVQELQRRSPVPLYFFRKENHGPAASRNYGLHRAKGEIVGFTDSDCRMRRDWVLASLHSVDVDSISLCSTMSRSRGLPVTTTSAILAPS